MRTITRLTGFSPALLRAWERRHKILEPERGPGGHRLYTEDDFRVLLHARDLLSRGRSIGEIAVLGRQQLVATARQRYPQPGAAADGGPDLGRASEAGVGPGEHPRLISLRKVLIERALAMDKGGFEHALDEAFSLLTTERVIAEIIKPVAHEVGDLWARGRCSVASEHLASYAITHRLRKLMEAAGPPSLGAPTVLNACFPDEQHELGALILSYHLARRGCPVVYMGPALPFEDLGRACDVLSPQVVLLSVARQALFLTHKPALLDLLRRQAARSRFFIGGRGAPSADPDVTDAGAQLFSMEHEAVDQIVTDILAQAHSSHSSS